MKKIISILLAIIISNIGLTSYAESQVLTENYMLDAVADSENVSAGWNLSDNPYAKYYKGIAGSLELPVDIIKSGYYDVKISMAADLGDKSNRSVWNSVCSYSIDEGEKITLTSKFITETGAGFTTDDTDAAYGPIEYKFTAPIFLKAGSRTIHFYVDNKITGNESGVYQASLDYLKLERATTPAEYVIEAYDYFANMTGKFQQSDYEGNNYLRYYGYEGGYIDMPVDIYESGYYDLSMNMGVALGVAVTEDVYRSECSYYIDGQKVDTFSSANLTQISGEDPTIKWTGGVIARTYAVNNPVYLEAGPHTIRFSVDKPYRAEANGIYAAALDWIKVTPVGSEDEPDEPTLEVKITINSIQIPTNTNKVVVMLSGTDTLVENAKAIFARYNGTELIEVDLKDVTKTTAMIAGELTEINDGDEIYFMLWDGMETLNPLVDRTKAN